MKGFSKGNFEGLLELLEKEWTQVEDQERLITEALTFGKKLNEEIVKNLHSLFGENLSFVSIISPEWTVERKVSRFSSQEKKYFTRFFMRSQIKVKVSPFKKFKFLVKWKEKLKDPETAPENYKINPQTTGQLKIQLVEKHEKSKTVLLSPMKQYEVAEELKDKIDLSSIDKAIRLKVQFSQKEDKDKLIISLELAQLQTVLLEQILNYLFRKLKKILLE
ncbi:MAG: hypothetical protein KAR35_06785 [Candidatus Heimdallarchaeota archaeon]|nr:hypothetical protein [Candidatus Heimdallarchaeota archaeon]MCK5049064.1 hypothetical protein [Candidatus Heimdallarchaeota archaeon]